MIKIKVVKSERGAVPIIEAALIFPIIFFCLFFLMYTGFYILQSVMMYTQAQKVAMISCKVIAVPGYESLAEDAAEGTQFDFASARGSSSDVKGVYSADNRIYRYFTSDPSAGGVQKLESALVTTVEGINLIESSDISCEISVKNYFITQEVEVKLTKKVTISNFFDYIRMGGKSEDIVVVAKAAGCDGAEFTRNVDTVYDFAIYLSEKLHISDKIENLMTKVKGAADNST